MHTAQKFNFPFCAFKMQAGWRLKGRDGVACCKSGIKIIFPFLDYLNISKCNTLFEYLNWINVFLNYKACIILGIKITNFLFFYFESNIPRYFYFCHPFIIPAQPKTVLNMNSVNHCRESKVYTNSFLNF